MGKTNDTLSDVLLLANIDRNTNADTDRPWNKMISMTPDKQILDQTGAMKMRTGVEWVASMITSRTTTRATATRITEDQDQDLIIAKQTMEQALGTRIIMYSTNTRTTGTIMEDKERRNIIQTELITGIIPVTMTLSTREECSGGSTVNHVTSTTTDSLNMDEDIRLVFLKEYPEGFMGNNTDNTNLENRFSNYGRHY